MAIRLRLPIPYHKAVRLILPCCLLLTALAIFLCGLVRTYYIDKQMTKNEHEHKLIDAQNEYMEWWLGFPLILCSVWAICTVFFDRPLLFKISVLALGTCFVLLLFGLLWDAGEFSWIARNMKFVEILRDEGFNCTTKEHVYDHDGHEYRFRECECKRAKEYGFGHFTPHSCELLAAQYYLYAFLSFAITSSIALNLFTLCSFVLILKRISQITTALHLDEKPLSEDFNNLHGDLYVES